MKNDGKDAEAAFLAYWETRGHVERLRDRKDLIGLNKGLKVADFKKPADFLVSSKVDELHYAEVKSSNDPVRFSFSSIQDGQSAAALKEARRGRGQYFFYIFSYQHSKWFVMSCHQYRAVLDEGRRSVKFEELKEWQK